MSVVLCSPTNKKKSAAEKAAAKKAAAKKAAAEQAAAKQAAAKKAADAEIARADARRIRAEENSRNADRDRDQITNGIVGALSDGLEVLRLSRQRNVKQAEIFLRWFLLYFCLTFDCAHSKAVYDAFKDFRWCIIHGINRDPLVIPYVVTKEGLEAIDFAKAHITRVEASISEHLRDTPPDSIDTVHRVYLDLTYALLEPINDLYLLKHPAVPKKPFQGAAHCQPAHAYFHASLMIWACKRLDYKVVEPAYDVDTLANTKFGLYFSLDSSEDYDKTVLIVTPDVPDAPKHDINDPYDIILGCNSTSNAEFVIANRRLLRYPRLLKRAQERTQLNLYLALFYSYKENGKLHKPLATAVVDAATTGDYMICAKCDTTLRGEAFSNGKAVVPNERMNQPCLIDGKVTRPNAHLSESGPVQTVPIPAYRCTIDHLAYFCGFCLAEDSKCHTKSDVLVWWSGDGTTTVDESVKTANQSLIKNAKWNNEIQTHYFADLAVVNHGNLTLLGVKPGSALKIFDSWTDRDTDLDRLYRCIFRSDTSNGDPYPTALHTNELHITVHHDATITDMVDTHDWKNAFFVRDKKNEFAVFQNNRKYFFVLTGDLYFRTDEGIIQLPPSKTRPRHRYHISLASIEKPQVPDIPLDLTQLLKETEEEDEAEGFAALAEMLRTTQRTTATLRMPTPREDDTAIPPVP
ncbi:hypothetical protein CYMTET_40120 [Cymbomonas tetramitiformis]|uniref:Uncharacterized protein n=1 Tax=Cymbomonas tetramitiformis TaxID=36881 RepID=A0AAE0CAG7_9CHLO|nr:hypothetical protein CYMTET_40120 [Cymbomonas tetramitiformis]